MREVTGLQYAQNLTYNRGSLRNCQNQTNGSKNMETALINEIRDALNVCLAKSDAIKTDHGMPRGQQLEIIGFCRMDGKHVTAKAMREHLKWNTPDAEKIAAKLFELTNQLESVPVMKRARAIKILNGTSQTYDFNSGKPTIVDAGGNPVVGIAPESITTEMVQAWAVVMEAA